MANRKLPVRVVYEGGSQRFMFLMSTFIESFPDIFERLHSLGLERSYAGLDLIRMVEVTERGAGVVSWYDLGKDVLSIYPMAFSIGTRIDLAVYAGLAQRYWHVAISNVDRDRWKRKLVLPDPAVIDRLSGMLKKGCSTYKSLIPQFHTATERLQVIHVLNALIRNSITPQQVQTLSLYEYPPTQDFCEQRKPYSLTPLLSAYTGIADVRSYDNAFAQFCSRKGHLPVGEISVEGELIELFKSVTFQRE